MAALAQSSTVRPLPKFIHPDDMPDIYCLKGVGVCMEPTIADGALLVFDKRERPKAGDFVGIVFSREAAARRGVPGLIKRLVLALPPADLPAGFSALVSVEQINPPRQFVLPMSDILAVHKFVGTAIPGKPGWGMYRSAQAEGA